MSFCSTPAASGIWRNKKALRKMMNLRALRKESRGGFGFLGLHGPAQGGLTREGDEGVGSGGGHTEISSGGRTGGRGKRGAPRRRPRFWAEVGEEEGSERTIRDHTLTPKQVTAFVSVMQGCDMHCSFCIVPTTRGKERSRPIAEIVDEVRSLVSHGVKEVTLLGQIVNMYGRRDLPVVSGRTPFVQLLEELEKVEGLERLRFTSPHPRGMKADLIDCYGRLTKLCEHLHLPVQSGSDRMLKVMGRGYTADQYRRILEQVRERSPGLGLTTDVIVGYPGETEEDYQATYRLLEEVEFDNAFIFRYSPREGTRAAKEKAVEIPENVKEERNQDLLRLLTRQAKARAKGRIGSLTEILVEGPSKTNPDRLTGRTRQNWPVVLREDRAISGNC